MPFLNFTGQTLDFDDIKKIENAFANEPYLSRELFNKRPWQAYNLKYYRMLLFI